MAANYSINEDALPSIIINRRAKTQKKIGKLLYRTIFEGEKYNYSRAIKEFSLDNRTLNNYFGNSDIEFYKNQKIIKISPKLSEDIKKTKEFLEKIDFFRHKNKDKKRLISVLMYLFFIKE